MSNELISRHTVLAALQRHIGVEHGVTAARLVREIVGVAGDVACERALREIVVRLRLDGYHICAHPSRGYFIARTTEELQATCRFLFSRAMTSLQQISRMKGIALPDLEGQLRLRT